VSEREWRFYVDDMIGFVEKVIVYTDGLDQNQFVQSSLNMMQLYVIWNCLVKLLPTFLKIFVIRTQESLGDNLLLPAIA
jgi:hypothetical protein